MPCASHILPAARIMAGIEASTMTSLGTCRFVMPLSEFTIASAGPRAYAALDVRLDRRASRRPAASGSSRPGRRSRCSGRPELLERRRVLREEVLEENAHGVTEDDGVGDLHHRRLQVQREQHALALRAARSAPRRNATQAFFAHDRGVDDLAGGERQSCPSAPSSCRRRPRTRSARPWRRARSPTVSFEKKSPLLIVRDVGLRILRPRAHRVRVLARVVLHGLRRAPVRVALAQHGVHRAAHAPCRSGPWSPSPRRSSAYPG